MFLEAERGQCRALFEQEDDVARRLVLADALLERGEPLGELVRLAAEGHPEAEVKARALMPRLLAELYPGATRLALDRGLPFAADFDVPRLLRAAPDRAPAWPLRWATLSGDSGALSALRSPLLADVERLSLRGCFFDPQLTMFVSGPPPPVPRLARLRHLEAPASPPPPHWRPLLTETFSQAAVLSLPPEAAALEPWLSLMPAVTRVDFALTGRALAPELREAALRWVGQQPGRELSLSGVTVAPAQLDALLTALGPALPGAPLDEVADPPTSRVSRVEVHEELAPNSGLVDATLDGQRGTWVRLQGDRRDFQGAVLVQQDLRLLMMAPLHPRVAGGQVAKKTDDGTWVLLGEGVRPLAPPRGRAAALDAAQALGEALGVLAGYVTQHTRRVAYPWPLQASDLLVGPDGGLRLLVPRQTAPVPDGGASSLGFPTRAATWSLAAFLAAVLVEWLTGRPLSPVRAPRFRVDDDWGEWERLTRFLEAPRVPAEVPADVAALVARAFSTRHVERLALPDFVTALAALPR